MNNLILHCSNSLWFCVVFYVILEGMKNNKSIVIAGVGFAVGLAVGFAACEFWETRARKREAKRRKERILKWCKYAFEFACKTIYAGVRKLIEYYSELETQ